MPVVSWPATRKTKVLPVISWSWSVLPALMLLAVADCSLPTLEASTRRAIQRVSDIGKYCILAKVYPLSPWSFLTRLSSAFSPAILSSKDQSWPRPARLYVGLGKAMPLKERSLILYRHRQNSRNRPHGPTHTKKGWREDSKPKNIVHGTLKSCSEGQIMTLGNILTAEVCQLIRHFDIIVMTRP